MEDKEWRTTKNKDGSLEWKGFPPYNTNSAIKTLDLENKARQTATADGIITNINRLTPDEMSMIADVNKHIGGLDERYIRLRGVIKNDISSLAKYENIESNLNNIKNEFNRKTQTIKDELTTKERFVLNAKKNLNNFRDINVIEARPAKYPESLLFHIAIVLVIILFEAGVNTSFFAEASGMGWLGGFVTASIVSGVNVAFSMFTGFFFFRLANYRNKNKKITYKKIAGLIGILISLMFIAVLHLAIAHYREVLSRAPDAEFHDVLGPLWNNPFGLQDVMSLFLIAIGVVISAVSIREGYHMDDYPGYRDVYCQWKNLFDEITVAKKGYRLAYHEAAAKTDEILKKLNDAKNELEGYLGDIDAYFCCNENYYNQAKRSAEEMHTFYRGIVQRIYGDPSRFPINTGLLCNEGALKTLNIELNNIEGDKSEVQSILADHIKKIDRCINEFPDKQKKFLKKLETECSELVHETETKEKEASDDSKNVTEQ